MKPPKITVLFVFLLLIIFPVFSQDFGTGAIFDPDRYDQVPLKSTLHARDYQSLPKAYSLKQYSPIPGDQGGYGTCVGWASAFTARTTSESIAIKRTNKAITTNNSFSPIYIYKSISNDPNGNKGSSIIDALNFMKYEGAVRELPDERTMDFKAISLSLYVTSKHYPISDYVRLIGGSYLIATTDERVLPIKKSISENKPVIISINCPPSFSFAWGTDLWKPKENPAVRFGGHALCIVGYDDSKYGGAFEIQNSWGTDWGNNGYIWMKYADFAAWYNEAYEIIENLTNFVDAANFAASIETQVDKSTQGMPVSYDKQGFYKTRSSYPSGTEFRFLMINRQPAYVYAFSADTVTSGIERIFPLQGVSPILDYSESTVVWPGELQWIKLNEAIGTDYLVVLFSKQALDIDAIEKRFANEKGSLPQRVSRAVGPDFIPYNQAQYKINTLEFSANSKNPRAVFGLLLAIDHRGR